MSRGGVAVFERAEQLPSEWEDSAAGSHLCRSMLALLEEVNPCGQRYLLARSAAAGGAASLAVTYRHRLNLLTFGPRRLRAVVPVRIVGVPCSVAAPGFRTGSPDSAAVLLAALRDAPGLTIVLNTDEPGLGPDFVSGPTLPACRLTVRWRDFDRYLASLRSSYRRRIRQALARGAALEVGRLSPPGRFDGELHRLYLNVHRRSAYPLECLDAPFFRRMDAEITVFRARGRPAGFVQTRRSGDRLVFLFGGLDHGLTREFDVYWNMLLHIVRAGIESGCREIDLGQTAETTKLRLGCRRVPLYLHATHRSPLVRRLLRPFRRALCHTPSAEEPHVFR